LKTLEKNHAPSGEWFSQGWVEMPARGPVGIVLAVWQTFAIATLRGAAMNARDRTGERRFKVVDGDRARLEAEIVEDLFLDRYDPAKAALLRPWGRLTLVLLRNTNTGEASPRE
jgi:hypothetical protein